MVRTSWKTMAVVLGFVTGCGSTNMTPTGPTQEPREPMCEFTVFTTPPEGYAEIAAIDVQPGGYGHNVFTDIADFKEEIRPSVCKAGGDAAIVFANGYGMYIKATVLKQVAGPAPRAPSGANAEAPKPSAPSDAGCRYDTQCKGDRICVKGECIAPAPAPAPSPAVPATP